QLTQAGGIEPRGQIGGGVAVTAGLTGGQDAAFDSAGDTDHQVDVVLRSQFGPFARVVRRVRRWAGKLIARINSIVIEEYPLDAMPRDHCRTREEQRSAHRLGGPGTAEYQQGEAQRLIGHGGLPLCECRRSWDSSWFSRSISGR